MVQARDDHWQQIVLAREDVWRLALLDQRRMDAEATKWKFREVKVLLELVLINIIFS